MLRKLPLGLQQAFHLLKERKRTAKQWEHELNPGRAGPDPTLCEQGQAAVAWRALWKASWEGPGQARPADQEHKVSPESVNQG